MKRLCDKYGIPTATEQGAPIVIKAEGLAAGKGVFVAMTLEEAFEAVDSMLVKDLFGSAGSRIIIEEHLKGEEASFFAIVDGEKDVPLESAQDHKRVGDGDTGPNRGGMGVYSPAPVLTKELHDLVMEYIIFPTVKGMTAEGCKYVGVLYAGLMIERKSGLPKLIEYNARFGDPECQVLMMRLESDLAQLLLAASRGDLSNVSLDGSSETAMVVVMAPTDPERFDSRKEAREGNTLLILPPRLKSLPTFRMTFSMTDRAPVLDGASSDEVDASQPRENDTVVNSRPALIGKEEPPDLELERLNGKEEPPDPELERGEISS